MDKKYLKLKETVELELSCSAHDMAHTMRVYRTSLELAKDFNEIHMDVLIPAVLLHDIARVREDRDKTGSINHAVLGAEMAGEILKEQGFDEEQITAIKHCIVCHRFRGNNPPLSDEAKILFDADKLDVLGAVGVARSFIIAGQYGEQLYSDVSVDDYVRSNLSGGKTNGRIIDMTKHAPNLEYETKFKRIIGVLNTDRARKIASERMAFMDDFFERLKLEINGLK
ncbi:MAG: HD domain-containing protein [Candidatus Hodarchaeales archaeon]